MTGQPSRRVGEHQAAAGAEPRSGPRAVVRRLRGDSGAGTDPDPAAAGPEPGRGQESTPGPARQAAEPGRVSPDMQVPRLLRQTAAWSWRLLLIALVIYFAFRLAQYLRLVTLPFIAAL